MLYQPSAIELEWTAPQLGSTILEEGICKVALRRSQMSAVADWLTFAEISRGQQLRAPTHNESVAVSTFVRRDGCKEYIEPLTGIARHPLSARVGCALQQSFTRMPVSRRQPLGFERPAPGPPGKYHLGYLILANHCGAADGSFCAQSRAYHSRGRNLLYDLGCSLFGSPMTRSDALYLGNAHTSSLQHFLALYGQNCIDFDSIWAWEAEVTKPDVWWKPVPPTVRAKMHFYNVFLKDPSDFTAVLNATARPEDHVVVKLDIDAPELEKAIVDTILADPLLLGLIDEFFFEYHFHMDNPNGPWGATQTQNKTGRNWVPDTVDVALATMQRLRRAGVRAHFWI